MSETWPNGSLICILLESARSRDIKRGNKSLRQKGAVRKRESEKVLYTDGKEERWMEGNSVSENSSRDRLWSNDLVSENSISHREGEREREDGRE